MQRQRRVYCIIASNSSPCPIVQGSVVFVLLRDERSRYDMFIQRTNAFKIFYLLALSGFAMRMSSNSPSALDLAKSLFKNFPMSKEQIIS